MSEYDGPKQKTQTSHIRISRLANENEPDFVAEDESERMSNNFDKEDLNLQFQTSDLRERKSTHRVPQNTKPKRPFSKDFTK